MTDDPDIVVLVAESIALEEQFAVHMEEDPDFADFMRRRAGGIGYSTRCRECRRILLALEDAPESPPWICDACGSRFWAAQLSDRARFSVDADDDVREAVELERREAIERGVSLRLDQLVLLADEALPSVLERRPGLHPDFVAAVEAEIERRATLPLRDGAP